MGNSIKFSIQLDYEKLGNRPPNEGAAWAAVAGTPLTGELVVEFNRRSKMKAGSFLRIQVSGKEKTAKRVGKHIQRAERSLLQVVAVLRDFSNETVRAGTYVFPFSLAMPVSLPGSMKPFESHQNGCSVQYKLIASCGKFSADRSFLVASHPFRDVKIPCFIEPKTETMKIMGLRKVGTVTFGVSAKDTQVGRGETIGVSIVCKNNAAVDLKAEIKLKEVVEWHTDKGSSSRKTVLVEKKNLALPELLKQNIQTVRDSLRERVDHHTKNCAAIYEALCEGHNCIPVKIPHRTLDTYAGNLIKVKHYIKVKLTTVMGANNLVVTIPIAVGNPPEHRNAEADVTHATPVSVRMIPTAPLDPEINSHEADLNEGPVSSESELPVQDFPFVTAVPIPEDAITAPVTVQEDYVLGGAPVHSTADEDSNFQSLTLEEIVPVEPPQISPSLGSLLQSMMNSVNDVDIISRYIADEAWLREVFAEISPTDFGTIVAHVNNDMEQPRIALLIAPHVSGFSCAHCVEAIRNTVNWNRATLVQNLKHHCVDFSLNQDLIWSELTSWERVVAEGGR